MANIKILKESLVGKRVLVAGGRGFIGKHLVNALDKAGSLVTTISITESSEVEERDRVEHLSADISDASALARVLGRQIFDYVFNLSGYIDHSPFLRGGIETIRAQYVGVLNLLHLVYRPQLKRFVHIGSSDEYGNAAAPQVEEFREAPIAPYSAAKAGITHLIQTLAKTESFPGVVARLFLVYGPGQGPQRFIPKIIKGCLEDSTFPTSLGEQLRDFCYIEDVVEGLILSAVAPKASGKVINIASGQAVSIRNVIEKIVELIGKGRADFGAVPYRSGESMKLYADTRQACELLAWKAGTSLEEGLKKTIAWYQRRLQI